MIRVPCLRVPQKFGDAAPLSGHCLFQGVGMMGVFVQVNEHSQQAKRNPVGYVIQENGCWEWVGGETGIGYAAYHDENGKTIRAHRWMYQQVKGPIPKGLCLDHLCRNRRCVNPDHMEPVTHRENTLRGVGLSANHARKTHCVNGHELTVENTYINKNKRICRKCGRDGKRRRYALLGGKPE